MNIAAVSAGDPVPLLELRGISKQFPGVMALDDVSFAVYPGEVHMLVGENGVGTVSGTLVGALILTLVLYGMNLLTIDASWQPLVTGVIVLLAVFFDTLTRKGEDCRK